MDLLPSARFSGLYIMTQYFRIASSFAVWKPPKEIRQRNVSVALRLEYRDWSLCAAKSKCQNSLFSFNIFYHLFGQVSHFSVPSITFQVFVACFCSSFKRWKPKTFAVASAIHFVEYSLFRLKYFTKEQIYQIRCSYRFFLFEI